MRRRLRAAAPRRPRPRTRRTARRRLRSGWPFTSSDTVFPGPSRTTSNPIGHASEDAAGGEAGPGCGNHRRDAQAAVGGPDAEDPLRRGDVGPGRRAGQPGVAAPTGMRGARARRCSGSRRTARSAAYRDRSARAAGSAGSTDRPGRPCPSWAAATTAQEFAWQKMPPFSFTPGRIGGRAPHPLRVARRRPAPSAAARTRS